MLTRYRVQNEAGYKLTIRVNPKNINKYVGGNVPMMNLMENRLLNSVPIVKLFGQRIVHHLGPFAIPECLYNKPVKLKAMKKYRKIKNFIENRADYRESDWYKSMFKVLRKDGKVKHKKITVYTVEELNHFFETYVLDLVNSMEKYGYIEEKSSQIGFVTIGRDGEIHKSNAGDHRFMTAKILGIKCMPFIVKGVHKEWFNNHLITNNRRGIDKLISAIRKVEEENL